GGLRMRHAHDLAEKRDCQNQVEEYAERQPGQAVDRKSRQVRRLGRSKADIAQTAQDVLFTRLRAQHRPGEKQRQGPEYLLTALGKVLAALFRQLFIGVRILERAQTLGEGQ